jgi:hypothetical protein
MAADFFHLDTVRLEQALRAARPPQHSASSDLIIPAGRPTSGRNDTPTPKIDLG